MADGDIKTREIKTETNGMVYAELTFEGMSTGGTFAPGMGADNDPAAAKIAFSVTRPGYTAAAGSTTYVDTVYGTRCMRKAYPDDADDDVTVSGSDAVAKVALSDFIYSGDTATMTALSGFYTESAVPTNAASAVAVTNSSTSSYPKPIGRWVTVPYQRVTGNFTVEFFGGHRSGRNNKPLACVVFTATDEHSHTSTSTVTSMTLSAANTSGIRLPVYAATIDVSTFTDGDTITVNAKAYPWRGDQTFDTSASADGVSQPDEREGPLEFLLDAAGTGLPPLYAVVDSATGSGSGVASTTLATAEATRCDTLATAKTKLAAIRANGENCVIYLVDNGGTGYAFNGSSLAFDQTTPASCWTIITPHPTLGTLAGCPISSGNNTSSTGKIKLSGLTLSGNSTGQIKGSATAGVLWVHDCTINMTGTAPIYTWKLVYATDNTVTAMNGGFVAFSTAKAPYKLFRGNDLTGLAASVKADLYCIVANLGNFYTNFLTTGNTPSQQISDMTVVAYNSVPTFTDASNAFVHLSTATALTGMLIACNVARSNNASHTGPMLSIIADSNVVDGKNIQLWHNSIKGTSHTNGRLNFGYNSKGTTGYSRVNWSTIGNNFDQWNNKDDTFTTDGGADGNRTGAWSVGYQLGGFGNVVEDTLFTLLFDGLYTDISGEQEYTDAANGDLTVTANSPSRNRYSAALCPLPYDLAGNPYSASGTTVTAGAYQYGADYTDPPTSGAAKIVLDRAWGFGF